MKDTILTNTLKRLKLVSAAEGWSFLILLFIAMPLKYAFDMPEAVRVVGMIHGILFVLYLFQVVQTKIEFNWSFGKMLLAFIASVIPFGTFYANAKLFTSEA